MAALKSWYISVGSNFIIHPVVQSPLFVKEEMETQRGEISWSKLASYLVLQLRQERLSLGSQPDAHSSSPGSRSFWEIM